MISLPFLYPPAVYSEYTNNRYTTGIRYTVSARIPLTIAKVNHKTEVIKNFTNSFGILLNSFKIVN